MIPGRDSPRPLIPNRARYLMAVGKVSDADFEAEVLKAQGPVVVDFWAEWCGHCRMIAPALDEISGAMGDKVKIVKLNGGEMASRQVGAAPKAKLQQWITASV